jgi:hypothetical protein
MPGTGAHRLHEKFEARTQKCGERGFLPPPSSRHILPINLSKIGTKETRKERQKRNLTTGHNQRRTDIWG